MEFNTEMLEKMRVLMVDEMVRVMGTDTSIMQVEDGMRELLRQVGKQALGTYLCRAETSPEAEIACGCGERACRLAKREAKAISVFGKMSYEREYYLCRACGQGQCPLDRRMGIEPGQVTSGLAKLLALAGVEVAFEEAGRWMEQFLLVRGAETASATGQFTWQPDGNTIVLVANGGAQGFAVGEGRVIVLKSDGSRPDAAGASLLRLESVQADARTGLTEMLVNHRWTLSSATGADKQSMASLFPSAERPFVFNFAGSRLHVDGGCNGLRGGYQLGADGLLTLSQLASTQMACDPPLMAADKALGGLLAAPLELVLVAGPGVLKCMQLAHRPTQPKFGFRERAPTEPFRLDEEQGPCGTLPATDAGYGLLRTASRMTVTADVTVTRSLAAVAAPPLAPARRSTRAAPRSPRRWRTPRRLTAVNRMRPALAQHSCSEGRCFAATASRESP